MPSATLLTIALMLALGRASPGAVAAPVSAAPPFGASRSSLTPDLVKVERHVLPNGLVVLLHEDHTVPAVTFYQWYKVGSRNERPGITGISHFFEHVAFNASPYRWPVLGWMGDLERIQRQEMVDYFRTHYAPNNCILVLTGDFDPRQALAQIQHYFGDIPSQTPPAPPVNSEPEQRGERRVEVHYPAQNVTFLMG